MVDLLERIDVMLEQEARSYMTLDYLSPDYQLKLAAACDDSIQDNSAASSSTSSSSSNSGINELWREKICEWSYQVIDHFDFSREVVCISIHYLDRFLATRHVNKKKFQLAAMTTLFLAIKLYEPGYLNMNSMIELSRGYFTVSQMAEMETSILRALDWKVHPPTAYCFAKHYLFLLPYSSLALDTRHKILELARFLTELAVIDYFFIVHKPSCVGLAAVLNAFEETSQAEDTLNELRRELKKVKGLDLDSPSIRLCRHRLNQLYGRGNYAQHTAEEAEPRNETVSPVCVSYGCNPNLNTSSLSTTSCQNQSKLH